METSKRERVSKLLKEVEKPCVAEVKKYLEVWESKEYEKYRYQEKSVVTLFRDLYPKNTKIEEVLIKVSVLNDFYKTNIFDTFSVAQHIVKLNIDNRLSNQDETIVDEIAKVKRFFYSFATKYCSHHQPEEFPIYDKFVKEMLVYFKSKEKFATFKNDDLKDYSTFKTIIHQFRQFFKLEQFSLRQLDLYLWILGRELEKSANK